MFTPILHINGKSDVTTNGLNEEGTAFMERTFRDYDFRLRSGGHVDTITPLLTPEIVTWAKENTNLQFSWFNPVSIFSGFLGGK